MRGGSSVCVCVCRNRARHERTTPRVTAQASASATSRLRRTGLALLVGAAAALGQAPFDLLPLSLIGFAGLLWLAYRESRGRAVLSVIFWSGTAYFGVALHWIVEPFLVDIARHGWMAPFALILIASGMALFWTVFVAAILKVGGLAPSRAGGVAPGRDVAWPCPRHGADGG